MVTKPRVAVLIGGVNGAGKTTFARQMLPLLHAGVTYLNVDEIQREGLFNHLVAASKEFFRRLERHEVNGDDFAIETTLSSPSYARRLKAWQSAGYVVILHFIELPDAEYAVRRVAERVAAGGHDIPEADIRRRFIRSKSLFHGVFSALANEWYHWASDEKGLRLVGKNP